MFVINKKIGKELLPEGLWFNWKNSFRPGHDQLNSAELDLINKANNYLFGGEAGKDFIVQWTENTTEFN